MKVYPMEMHQLIVQTNHDILLVLKTMIVEGYITEESLKRTILSLQKRNLFWTGFWSILEKDICSCKVNDDSVVKRIIVEEE